MPNPMIPTTLLLLLVAPAAGDDGRPPRVEQWTVRQRIIIRIPALPVSRPAKAAKAVAPGEIRYAEKKGPKCVSYKMLAGSAITRSDSIDLTLTDGSRVRAKLGDDCPALDFYAGFYLKPDQDGMICADRDSVRSRAGDSCEIDDFKKLVPKH